MFVGHFGVGFGAKRLAPEISLGTLFLGAQFVDLLWPTFLLLGWERVEVVPGITEVVPLDFVHYPWTHSLVASLFWSVALGVVYFLISRYKVGAWVCGGAVLSHWILDFFTHQPDLLLWPGGASRWGLGLWNSLPATLAVELSIFAVGLWLYSQGTRPRDRTGRWAFWALVIFLLTIHGANILGPPPPHVAGIAWMGQAQWLIVLWGYWVDRHRENLEMTGSWRRLSA